MNRHVHTMRHTRVVSHGLREAIETGELEHIVADELVKIAECPDCLSREKRIAALDEARDCGSDEPTCPRGKLTGILPCAKHLAREARKAVEIIAGLREERDEALRARDEAKEQVKEWKDRRGMAQDDIDAIIDVRECLAKEHRADETEVDTIVRALNERDAALAQVEALRVTIREAINNYAMPHEVYRLLLAALAGAEVKP